MPANPVEVDVIVLPTAPIGVTIADTIIVVDATVNIGGVVAVDVIVGGGISSGGGGAPAEVTPTGTIPGTSFTLPFTPAGQIVVLNGFVLIKTASAPAVDEYRLVGLTLTTGVTVTSTDKLRCWLWA